MVVSDTDEQVPGGLSVADEVITLLNDYFPQGLQTPTTAAETMGRVKVLNRDPANEA